MPRLGWVLGGYVGATMLGVMTGGVRLSSARSVIYLGGVNLTGPLIVLCCYAVAGPVEGNR
jgi:hypothetical protein